MAEQWSRRKFCLALGTLSAGARLGKAEAGMESLPFKLGVITDEIAEDIRKDPTTGKLQRVPVGEGMIDFRGQFTALRDDGYDGTMSLETGYLRPDGNKVETTRECLEGLFRVLKHVCIPYPLATHSESAFERD
jgi:hypothetical protein